MRQIYGGGGSGGLDLVVFLHERAARGPGGGQKRLVVVMTGPILDDGLYFCGKSWSTGTISSKPKKINTHHGGLAEDANIGVLRVFAGQADPKDDSHFAIEFVTRTGGRGKVDGWLEADDSITLVVGPVTPAATGP